VLDLTCLQRSFSDGSIARRNATTKFKSQVVFFLIVHTPARLTDRRDLPERSSARSSVCGSKLCQRATIRPSRCPRTGIGDRVVDRNLQRFLQPAVQRLRRQRREPAGSAVNPQRATEPSIRNYRKRISWGIVTCPSFANDAATLHFPNLLRAAWTGRLRPGVQECDKINSTIHGGLRSSRCISSLLEIVAVLDKKDTQSRAAVPQLQQPKRKRRTRASGGSVSISLSYCLVSSPLGFVCAIVQLCSPTLKRAKRRTEIFSPSFPILVAINCETLMVCSLMNGWSSRQTSS
jgi:hypothetical protein